MALTVVTKGVQTIILTCLHDGDGTDRIVFEADDQLEDGEVFLRCGDYPNSGFTVWATRDELAEFARALLEAIGETE